MALIEGMSETMRKVFLAGVGAVAFTAEKSSELIDELVKKGELTVEQGNELNEELKRRMNNAADDGESAVLRAHLKGMSPEEREAFAAKVAKINADISTEAVEVEVEEVAADEAEAEPADAVEAEPAAEADDKPVEE